MRIFIYGGGGHGKVVIETVIAQYGKNSIGGIFDDDPDKKNKFFHGQKIIGSLNDFNQNVNNLIIAIGDNTTRKKRSFEIANLVSSFTIVAHPSAIISDSAQIGEGTLLMPNVIVNADTSIGKHCIINSRAVIEHDCEIGDFSHVAPGAVLTGMVKIGSETLIGANSVIVPGKTIGNNCLIAAGSVVTKDIPDFAIVRGNPAKIIKIVEKKYE